MIVITWTVRRAKKSQFQQEVGFINRAIVPDILIFVETKVNERNTKHIIKTLATITMIL